MSKAEELLNSLVEAYEAESNPSSDAHIVIGADRFILVPEELKRIAVQYDHNMRTVTFDCPRYYDGRDMSKMTVYINIRGPKGAPHSYIADNVRVDTSNPTMMHFDWTIKRPLTDVYGKLIFLVCVRKADGEGNEENHWNTELNTELYISEGMEYEELEEHPYSDIVTQLLQRMDGVEALANPEAMQGYANAWLDENSNKVLADIQSKGDGVLASIPAEYADVHANANEGARTKADAIIRTVDGDVISVNDSSDDYVRGLRVFGRTDQVTTTGKNMIPMTSATREYYEVTIYTNADGSVRAVGTPNASDYPDFAAFDTGMEITLSANVEYILSGSENRMIYGLRKYSGEIVCRDEDGSGVRYTPSTDETVKVYVFLNRYETYDAISHPMLRLASNGDPSWEPYTGGAPSPSPEYPQELVSVEKVTVNIYGKNILDETQMTYHPDYKDMYSSVLAARDYHVEKGKTYTLSFDTENTGVLMYVNPSSGFEYKQFVMDGTRHSFTVTMKKDVVSSDTSTPIVSLAETSAVECGLISNVLIEMRDSATEYEPYKEPQTVSIVRALPGIPVSSGGNYVDANGKWWICDEVDFERDVYVQRVKKTVITGTPQFNETADSPGRFSWFCLTGEYKNGREACLCNYAAWRAWGIGDGVRDYGAVSINQIYYSPAKTMTAAEVNSKFAQMIADGNPPVIIGQLETPIETPLSAEELNAFRAIRSNYHNTTVLNDSGVKMELKYNADTQLYIDNKIAEAVAALANKA